MGISMGQNKKLTEPLEQKKKKKLVSIDSLKKSEKSKENPDRWIIIDDMEPEYQRIPGKIKPQ